MLNASVFTFICWSLFAHGHALAQPAAGQRIEVPVRDVALSGTLGKKSVNVVLVRVGDRLSGSYCYEPCAEKTRLQLQVNGTIVGNDITLTERDSNSRKKAPTGQWSLHWEDETMSGNWISPDGSRKFAVSLHDSQPFPFEIRLVADAMPSEKDDCDAPPHVSAIRLYRKKRLVQELATDSEGTCNISIPFVVDANFDGLPDLTIALGLPAEPNIPHQTWLYDPSTQRFVDAPQALQDISSPEFDTARKTVVSQWRNGCCEHGVTTYRWNGDRLEETATAASVQLPVLAGGKILYCYSIPSYVDGHIEYADRVEQVGDRLVSTLHDFGSCNAEAVLEKPLTIDVWKRDAAGELKHLRSENTEWKRVATTVGPCYCPEIPFFTNGQIKRTVLRDHPEQYCSETAP